MNYEQLAEALPKVAMWAQQTVQSCEEFDAVCLVLRVSRILSEFPTDAQVEAEAIAQLRRVYGSNWPAAELREWIYEEHQYNDLLADARAVLEAVREQVFGDES